MLDPMDTGPHCLHDHAVAVLHQLALVAVPLVCFIDTTLDCFYEYNNALPFSLSELSAYNC